jgi:hypothetical protein
VTNSLHKGYGRHPIQDRYRYVTHYSREHRQTDTLRLGMAKRMHLEVLNLRMRF